MRNERISKEGDGRGWIGRPGDGMKKRREKWMGGGAEGMGRKRTMGEFDIFCKNFVKEEK